MRTKIIIDSVLLLFCVVSILPANEKAVYRSDSVRVFYSEGNRLLAQRVAKESTQDLKELSSLFNLPFTGEAFLFLEDNRQDWQQATGEQLPEWSQAVTKTEMGIVYLLVKPESDRDLSMVLRHELVHVLLGRNVPSRQVGMPRWFEEGVAMLYSGESLADYASILSRANLTNSLLTLDEIESVLQFQRGKANLAYAESFLSVKLIVDALGWPALGKLLQATIQQQDWQAAFQSVLDMNTDQFQWRLFEYVHNNYRWNFILQSDYLIWVLIPILAVTAFLIIRLRNYRTYRRWEEEEEVVLDDHEDREET